MKNFKKNNTLLVRDSRRYNGEEEEQPQRAAKKHPKGRPKHRRVLTPVDGPIIEEPDSEENSKSVRAEPISPAEVPAKKQQHSEREKDFRTNTQVNQSTKRPPPITERPTHYSEPILDKNYLNNSKGYDSERYKIEYTGNNRGALRSSQKTLIKRTDAGNSARQKPMEKPKGYVLVRKPSSNQTALPDSSELKRINVPYSNNMTNTVVKDKPLPKGNADDNTNTRDIVDSHSTEKNSHPGMWMP